MDNEQVGLEWILAKQVKYTQWMIMNQMKLGLGVAIGKWEPQITVLLHQEATFESLMTRTHTRIKDISNYGFGWLSNLKLLGNPSLH